MHVRTSAFRQAFWSNDPQQIFIQVNFNPFYAIYLLCSNLCFATQKGRAAWETGSKEINFLRVSWGAPLPWEVPGPGEVHPHQVHPGVGDIRWDYIGQSLAFNIIPRRQSVPLTRDGQSGKVYQCRPRLCKFWGHTGLSTNYTTVKLFKNLSCFLSHFVFT